MHYLQTPYYYQTAQRNIYLLMRIWDKAYVKTLQGNKIFINRNYRLQLLCSAYCCEKITDKATARLQTEQPIKKHTFLKLSKTLIILNINSGTTVGNSDAKPDK